MLSLLCSTGIDLWFLYEEANLTEDVRLYKKGEYCGKMTAIKERRTETREKTEAA